ncbi:MAG TPA: hypothetical protein VEP90_26465 [Methylomirabilota bacterium]|nr:hypothetical protein [Methylomirabilota bacterium]
MCAIREIVGDIWKYHQRGSYVVITTNLITDRKGNAVMGAGIALQAAEKFPDIKRIYGKYLREGYKMMSVPQYRLFLLPTKIHWKQPSNLELIEEGLDALVVWSKSLDPSPYVALPRIGCGLGKLDWNTQVRPIVEKYLSTPNFAVINPF